MVNYMNGQFYFWVQNVYWNIVGIREKLEITRMFKVKEIDE